MTNSDRSDTMTAQRSFKKQFGLNNDEKLFLSVQPPSILINLRNWPHHCGEFVRIGAAVQSRTFQVSALAEHWAVSWRPDARGRRRAFATERFLYGPGERRRLEDR